MRNAFAINDIAGCWLKHDCNNMSWLRHAPHKIRAPIGSSTERPTRNIPTRDHAKVVARRRRRRRRKPVPRCRNPAPRCRNPIPFAETSCQPCNPAPERERERERERARVRESRRRRRSVPWPKCLPPDLAPAVRVRSIAGAAPAVRVRSIAGAGRMQCEFQHSMAPIRGAAVQGRRRALKRERERERAA